MQKLQQKPTMLAALQSAKHKTSRGPISSAPQDVVKMRSGEPNPHVVDGGHAARYVFFYFNGTAKLDFCKPSINTLNRLFDVLCALPA